MTRQPARKEPPICSSTCGILTYISSMSLPRPILLLLSLVLFAVAHAEQRDPAKPNVILFLVDDMGWMDSEPYGSQYYDTPNMQRLADQGMRFTRSYASPNCSPTRASILTGQYPSRHGIWSAVGHQPPEEAKMPASGPPNRPVILPESRTFLDPSQFTLAEALQGAGYRTGHFGKWHLGLMPDHWPDKQGFEVAFHAEPSAGPPNAYFSPYGVRPAAAPGTPLREIRGTPHGTITDGPEGEYITDRLTDEAMKFIADNKDRPFFLNLWHYGVHGPWGHQESITAEMAKRTDPTGRQGNPVMASMLKSVDDSLGRILDQLDELGIADNTIFIFASDNGGNVRSMTTDKESETERKADAAAVAAYRKWAAFQPPTNNEPLRDGKGTIYEGGTRVPLVFRWPGKIAADTTCDEVVGCIDYYPTILALTGTPPDPGQTIDGISLAPVLLGQGSLPRDAYFTWMPRGQAGVSVVQGDWKLIRRFWPRPADYEGMHELFNLKDDLGEQTNLAGNMPEKVKELDALIDQFVQETGALYPQPNPQFAKGAGKKNNDAPEAGE
jgi:arylsulfatase A-like enzyme